VDALIESGAELRESGLDVHFGGELLSTFEAEEGSTAEIVGLIVAAIVLLVAFGSVYAMAVPIGTALVGLACGLAAVDLAARSLPVPEWAPLLGSMIGIGVGIDYALFLVSRHQENLLAGHDVQASIRIAGSTAGTSVLFAGSTVVVSILGLSIAGLPQLTAAAVTTSVIVVIAVAAAITVVPAALSLIGRRLGSLSVRGPGTHTSGDHHRWRSWVTRITNHPLRAVVLVMVGLAIAGSPVLAMNLGFPDDGTLPATRTERQAYDLIAAGFGPGANGPFAITIDAQTNAEQVIDTARTVLVSDPGIASVDQPILNADATAALLVAYPTTSPQDPATGTTLRRLRSDLAAASTDGAAISVGGFTATEIDLADRLQTRTPWIIVTVAGLSFALLVIMFRSVFVPLKAAILNLVSISASYGAVVAVFQWGWLGSVFGVEATGPVIALTPMFMFAVLFGLSMDYEVFLLSRIQEAHQQLGDTTEAVITGLASTARIITSAALIMIAVFVGFVFSPDPVVKSIALGLAIAIFVDAAIVRTILVPATMQLLGERNWWLPTWLDRILPRAELHHGTSPVKPPLHSVPR
jgi:putative drug exporter of the RND superfamily